MADSSVAMDILLKPNENLKRTDLNYTVKYSVSGSHSAEVGFYQRPAKKCKQCFNCFTKYTW